MNNLFEQYIKNACRFVNEGLEDELPAEAPAELPAEGGEELPLDGEEEALPAEGEDAECEESMEDLKAQIADLQGQVTELLELVQSLTGEAAEGADDLAGEEELPAEGGEELEDEDPSFEDEDM